MSEVPRHLPPPSNPALAPILATVAYLATLVAVWGGIGLALDRTVIDYPDAGPLLGPAMAVAASAVTWSALVGVRHGRNGALLVVAATIGSFAGMLGVGAIGYASVRADPSWLLLAAGHLAVSPFVAVAAGLSGAVVLALWGFDRRVGADYSS